MPSPKRLSNKIWNNKINPSKRRHARLIAVLFATCLLLGIAAPWTVTESNASGGQKDWTNSGTGFTSASSSSTTNLRSFLGFVASNAGQNKTAEQQLAPQLPSSSDGVWQGIDKQAIVAAALQSPSASYQALRLNKQALEQQLQRAPMEFTGDLRESPAILSLPMPDGSFERFHIEESPIIEPSLAARLPGVKTYRGQGIDDPAATTRFDWTPQGFHAIVLSSRDSVYVGPAASGETENYVTHFSQALPGGMFECGVTEADVAEATGRGVYSHPGKPTGLSPEVNNGPTLRTYRLAVAATGEWTTQYGGGTVPGAQTAITTMTNLVDAIYEKEVAIRFTLVNNTNIIFTNAGTDPYVSPNVANSAALTANQTALDTAVGLGDANYDIGHLFGSGASFFSGLAQLGVTCSTGSKARGASTMNGGTVTTGVFINGIAHEFAHQFSATHTFNATTGTFCGAQRDGTSAYEVGGGSTIMSYQVCEAENLQPQSDNYFHVRSLEQILDYAVNTALCATTPATGNVAPAVTGPGNFTIPISTPFNLTATATDTNGPLTYSWEEYDLGTAAPPNTDNGSRPIFRGYRPTSSSSRTFPSLQYVLNNANVPPATYNGGCFDNVGNPIQCLTGESLPTTSRTMNFQVVVRDNQANGGGINTAASVLTVSNTAGPFLVTAPNGGGTLSGAQNVTWSVNNTNLPPVSAANVKITLSTDGGFSFPITLAASTPNIGTAPVVLPNGIISSTARVKVEAVGNIFFDISDANFSIVPADTCPAVSDISPKAGNVGDTVTITGFNFMTGGNVTGVKFQNNVTATFSVVNDTTLTTTVPAGAVGGPITVSKTGCPDVQTAGYNVCPTAPVALSIDDGSVESANTIGPAYYVNRLTPGGYPATLSKVSIFWDPFQNFPPGTAINVVAGISAGGGGANIDGTGFQTFAATAGAQPGFTTYTLPIPIKITSGDFVVGFQALTAPAGVFPAAVDTGTSAGRSYRSVNGTTFSTLAAGNYMIRAAQVYIGACNGPTAAPATISGQVTTADGQPLAGVTMNLSGSRTARAITDSSGNYRFSNVDTDNFYVVTPALTNYNFGPESRSFSLLANKTDAVFTAARDAVIGGNAIDSAGYFVRQHYLDFLGREPDEAGFNFWSNQILDCGPDAACIERRTINVSAAYFLSIEFAQTGGLVDGLYRASYGRRPLFAEFIPDTQLIGSGVVVGSGDWMRQLTLNKEAFLAAWVQRADFRAAYDGLSNDAYVNALIDHTGVSFDASERAALVSSLSSGTSRAEALRQIAENDRFVDAKRNEMFVMMEYFGYLRRDPDEAGYQFWLNKLKQFDGNFERAEMVKAFITSGEYRQRFGL